jgi:SAM-dependent methyltransferase
MTTSDERLDFGYSYWWMNGHLLLGCILIAAATALAVVGQPVWVVALPCIPGGWALIAAVLMRFVFRSHLPLTLPTERFLPGDFGTVLDLGCGSGRTSIMVGQYRPGARITALDNFSATYIDEHGEGRLSRNLTIAAVADRVTFQRGDMLELPFENASFDAAVSSYALDHLGRDIPRALAEAHRVLRPGGQLLLMVILPDGAMNVVFPGVVALGFHSRRAWRRLLADAGFELEHEGAAPGQGFLLARRPIS